MNRAFTRNRTEAFLRYFDGDRFAKRSGMSIEEIGYGRATTRFRPGPEHVNAAGMVMGGALFTLCDYALAAASNAYGHVAVGLEMHFNLLEEPSPGVLRARASEVRRGRTIGVYQVDLEDETGTLCARMSGTVRIFEGRELFPGAIDNSDGGDIMGNSDRRGGP